jgi:hypothetical protein
MSFHCTADCKEIIVMKFIGFAASALLTMSITPWLAGSASAGEQVPFKGTLEGTYTSVPVDPSVPLIVFNQLDATGNATHLGKFTYDFPHVVDRTLRPSIGIGSATFTAANGDQVFADIVGEATLIVPGLLSGVEHGAITGGTGRFEGATDRQLQLHDRRFLQRNHLSRWEETQQRRQIVAAGRPDFSSGYLRLIQRIIFWEIPCRYQVSSGP